MDDRRLEAADYKGRHGHIDVLSWHSNQTGWHSCCLLALVAGLSSAMMQMRGRAQVSITVYRDVRRMCFLLAKTVVEGRVGF